MKVNRACRKLSGECRIWKVRMQGLEDFGNNSMAGEYPARSRSSHGMEFEYVYVLIMNLRSE